jgi:hypothetical protein
LNPRINQAHLFITIFLPEILLFWSVKYKDNIRLTPRWTFRRLGHSKTSVCCSGDARSRASFRWFSCYQNDLIRLTIELFEKRTAPLGRTPDRWTIRLFMAHGGKRKVCRMWYASILKFPSY